MEEMRHVGYAASEIILSTSNWQYHTDLFKDFTEDAQHVVVTASGPIDRIYRGSICDLRVVFTLLDYRDETKLNHHKDIKDVLCTHVFSRLMDGHPVWEYHFMKP